MDRRGFLGLVAAAGLVGLTGCTPDSSPPPTPSGSAAPSAPALPDDTLRTVTFASEAELVERYAAAILTAEPAVARLLRALQAQHVEHARRLRPDTPVVSDSPTAEPSPQASPTLGPALPSGPPDSTADSVPTASRSGEPRGASSSPAVAVPRPRAVLASLAEAERVALRQRRDASGQAEDPELVRTLCLIAASEGQHVGELRELRAGLAR